MNAISGTLNSVASTGEERAALSACMATANNVSLEAAEVLNPFAPISQGDLDTLTMLTGAMQGELNILAASQDTDNVDPDQWSRARDEITRSYITASGVEGTVSALPTWRDDAQILADAVVAAPKVFVEAVQTVAGAGGNVADWTIQSILGIVWAALKPIWPWVLVGAVIIAFVLVPELGLLAGRLFGRAVSAVG